MTGRCMTAAPASALAGDMSRLGVRPGDTLMVHASLRAIGPVANGADGVLDALHLAIGERGSLLMILGAEIEHDWVNALPEAERLPLLERAPPFDPEAAPVLHEVGTFAEIFRRRPGTIVSDNPSGRFGARGHLAHALIEDAPWNDYYGPGSPLERFCDAGGRILRLGASFDTTTALHYAEYLAEVPGKRRVRRHYRCIGETGPETRAVECLDDANGIVDWPGEDYFAVILKDYLAGGHARRGRVGQAASELIEAGDLVAFGKRWMTENLSRLASPGDGADSVSGTCTVPDG